jgi:hypothetical protein
LGIQKNKATSQQQNTNNSDNAHIDKATTKKVLLLFLCSIGVDYSGINAILVMSNSHQ